MPIIRANTLLIAIAFIAATSCVARAGDHYFECATPGGNYQLNEEDELRQGDKVVKYKTLRKITISQQEGTCTTKGGKVFKWDSHAYLIELAVDSDGHQGKLMFLCESAGSGVPANESDSQCTTRTTFDKQLRPAYRIRKK